MYARTTRTAANLLLAVAFAVSVFINTTTHDAPRLESFYASPVDAVEYAGMDKPVNTPAWGDVATDHPACERLQDGAVYDTVVIVDQHGDSHRMPFDTAWGLATDHEPANDVWTVGGCP